MATIDWNEEVKRVVPAEKFLVFDVKQGGSHCANFPGVTSAGCFLPGIERQRFFPQENVIEDMMKQPGPK